MPLAIILEKIGFLKKWLKMRENMGCIFGIHPKQKRKMPILIGKTVNFVMPRKTADLTVLDKFDHYTSFYNS